MFDVPLGFDDPAPLDPSEAPGVRPGPDAPPEPLIALLPPQRIVREVPPAVRADARALMRAGGLPIRQEPRPGRTTTEPDEHLDHAIGVVLTSPSGARAQVPDDGFAVIGRLPGSALLIDNPGISRRHCRVGHRGGVAILEDLFSGNGTWVNRGGVRIDVPRGSAVDLSSDDWVFSLDIPLFRVTVSAAPT